MILQLPLVPAVPFYRVGVTLNGKDYLLDLRWNSRANTWFMDVLQADETPIRHGIRLTTGAVHGARSTDPEFPFGGFGLVNLAGDGSEAGLDDINIKVGVYHFQLDDL